MESDAGEVLRRRRWLRRRRGFVPRTLGFMARRHGPTHRVGAGIRAARRHPAPARGHLRAFSGRGRLRGPPRGRFSPAARRRRPRSHAARGAPPAARLGPHGVVRPRGRRGGTESARGEHSRRRRREAFRARASRFANMALVGLIFVGHPQRSPSAAKKHVALGTCIIFGAYLLTCDKKAKFPVDSLDAPAAAVLVGIGAVLLAAYREPAEAAPAGLHRGTDFRCEPGWPVAQAASETRVSRRGNPNRHSEPVQTVTIDVASGRGYRRKDAGIAAVVR
ncbi:hypothetical protein M885DRAFT_521757 [Pelagophyceae sp. CCMP2097]|nr:hypothetical protein M885DRAFT_521757 [Pelagophyceae sp. CCMP2097]